MLANSHTEARAFVAAFICVFVNIYRRFFLILFIIPCLLFKKIYRLPRYIFVVNNRYFFYFSRFVLNLLFCLFFVLLTVHAVNRNTRYNLGKKTRRIIAEQRR